MSILVVPKQYMKKFTMKKIIAVAMLLFIATGGSLFAQEKCLTEILFQEEAARDPQLLRNREMMEEWTRQYIEHMEAQEVTENGAAVIKVIPVVVHVIHFGGAENISKAQILDQINILNADFTASNPDTANTPAVFKPLIGNTEVEFRMAQLDPNGNCTDGIVRVYSPLTVNARNNVKALSYWPSNQYLNIWVVASIANTGGSPGQVIGFAQFPGTGLPTTDGVVIKHDFMGNIGTAANSNNAGRTATHEIGHWLNLRHIWGDATCGNDFVSDTPPHFEANLSICPTWPHLSNCAGNSPNGDMYVNYMDYTNGDCQNMFSTGQAARMNAALASATSGRNNLWTSNNLALTGTDGTPAVLCPPKADFVPRPRLICEGGSTQFVDISWRGEVASRVWNFPGGTPANDTSRNPVVVYNTPGVYDVSLTVTNASGTDTKVETGIVIVSPNNVVTSVPFFEGFEGGVFPSANDWYMINTNGGSAWEVNNIAAATGQYSINLYNFSGNDKGPDEFITNAFNLSNVTATSMTFDMAFAYPTLTGTNTDKLTVYFSTNCGQTWMPRYAKTGAALATTATAINNDFFPTSAQWRTETVNLSPTSVSTKPNVRFRFEFSHDTGNNLYIDNINLSGTVGVNEVNADNANVVVYPNPSTSFTYVDFNMTYTGKVVIDVMDVQGRVMSTFSDELPAGEHQYTMSNELAKGVYFVRLTFGDNAVTKKVVIK